MLWLQGLEQLTIHQLVNAKGTEELLELKGKLNAYHKVLVTLTKPAKEEDEWQR